MPVIPPEQQHHKNCHNLSKVDVSGCKKHTALQSQSCPLPRNMLAKSPLSPKSVHFERGHLHGDLSDDIKQWHFLKLNA